jgi:hypothetical protein
VALIVCLFGCNLSAVAAKPLPSMNTQAVHGVVEKLGVGEPISARLSSSGPGPVQYTDISGKISSISDQSFGLSVKKGRKVSLQTFAYKDVDEIHGTRVNSKYIVLATAITVSVFAALIAWNRNTVQH